MIVVLPLLCREHSRLPNHYVSCNLNNHSRRATWGKLATHNSVHHSNEAETPDKAHLSVSNSFASSVTTLDIKTPAVPCTMIVPMLTVLRLSLRAMRRYPLRRQIPLPNRQESCQPEHGATTREHLRNMLSCLRQHG